MPSIPQSLLWISLVVLWLFVLVPMLVSKRDNVRRTSDVALATRVLNSGRNARLRRPRAAAGHHSDPDWRPAEDEYEDIEADIEADIEEDAARRRSVVLAAAAPVAEESPYLDVDVVDEDSGALPIGESFQRQAEAERAEEPEELTLDFDAPEPEPAPQPVAEATEEAVEAAAEELEEAADEAEDAAEDAEEAAEADDYEYVDDTSGLEAEDGFEDDDEPALAESMASARRNRYESKTSQAVSARKYTFRKRVLLSMAVAMGLSAVLAAVVSPSLWWLVGVVVAVTVLYLAYLRRQTRIEEQLRRRRAQRVMRSRLGVENTGDDEFDVVPSRLRRPGAAVLEIDDEDPAFEHLAYARFARDYDLPRAAGQ